MKLRTILLLPILLQLTGCIVTPRIEFSERIDFNYMPTELKPVTYSDLICCYRCEA